MRIGIVVCTFNRTQQIIDCLTSILKLDCGSHEVFKIIISQRGMNSNRALLSKFENEFEIVEVERTGKTPLECINLNRIHGIEIAFEKYGVEAVINVEDDVLVGRDSLQFASSVHNQFSNNKNFMLVNFGSRIPPNLCEETNSYSLIRYGMHGQASWLPVQTWNRIKKKRLLPKSTIGFDSAIEAFIKTGFVVTPNRSRYLDTGWDDKATHATKDPGANSYREMKASFFDSKNKSSVYIHKQLDHRNWRFDSIAYHSSHDFWHKLKYVYRVNLLRLHGEL